MNTVLFDLDGTLLPMDQDVFVKAYFKALAARFAPAGYEAAKLVEGVWAGTDAMVKNDGSKFNSERFWDKFSEYFGERVYADIPRFDDFYSTDFCLAKKVCGFNERAGKLVRSLKERGLRVVLASNPVFPLVAQKNRMRWAGVDPEDFFYITHYENSRYCKPNPAYYAEILEKNGLKSEECVMIGNDVREDRAAEKVGIETFILTDCLINRDKEPLEDTPHGGFDELEEFLRSR